MAAILASCMTLAMLILPGAAANGASSSVVVSFNLLSSTSLATTCTTGSAGATFGSVVAGTPAVTGSDCAMTFGSTNDTATLQVFQQDLAGRAMVRPATGVLDPGFGTAGVASWDVTGGSDLEELDQVLPVPGSDGDVYAIGAQAQDELVIARFDKLGNLVTTWNDGDGSDGYVFHAPGSIRPGEVVSAAVHPDGSLTVATPRTGGDTHTAVMRFDPNGDLDGSWGISGMRTVQACDQNGGDNYEWPLAVEPLDDGSVVIAGGCQITVSVDAEVYAIRIDAAGDHDTSFGTGGVFTWDTGTNWDRASGLVRDSAGRLVLSVLAYQGGATSTAVALRLTADGQLDPTWDGDGTNQYGGNGVVGYLVTPGERHEPHSVALATDGSGDVLLAGARGTWGTPQAFALRLDSTGERRTSYGTSGWATFDPTPGVFDEATALVPRPDGTLVVGGTANTGDARDAFTVLLRSDGSIHPDWPIQLHDFAGFRDTLVSIVESTDGALVLGTRSHRTTTDSEFTLWRYDSEGLDDYVNLGGAGDRDWSSGASNSLFGICLRALGGGANPGGDFTVDGAGSCAPADTTPWSAIPQTAGPGSRAAATGSGNASGTAAFRFGARPASNQPPGRYQASVTFAVVAPAI